MRIAATGRPRPKLLVCLDAQRANIPEGDDRAALEVQGRVENCRRILDHARMWDWNIVHVYHRRGAGGQQSPPIEGLEPRPNEPVILLTGFADLIDDPEPRTESVDMIVSKPARLDDLRRAIMEVMRRN